jgi:hypothetical protein
MLCFWPPRTEDVGGRNADEDSVGRPHNRETSRLSGVHRVSAPLLDLCFISSIFVALASDLESMAEFADIREILQLAPQARVPLRTGRPRPERTSYEERNARIICNNIYM